MVLHFVEVLLTLIHLNYRDVSLGDDVMVEWLEQ